MRALCTAGNAARLDHVAKQAEIGEVETHGSNLGGEGRPTFAFSEAKLREIPIVRQVSEGHIRR
jgi:hypothetical protein